VGRIGLQARSGLTLAQCEIPKCCGYDIQGDEKRRGATSNYARIFTWWQFAATIAEEFETALAEQNRPNNDARAEYSPASAPEIEAYPEWIKLDSSWWQRFAAAISMAIFLQWGTTGAAIKIAYLTGVRGLGCRSFTYLLYGSFATAAFVFLLGSVFISHQAMLMHQRKPDQPRTLKHNLICALAVITRIFGKVLAVSNALLIILTSIWELVGFFDNCWCLGTVLQLRENAWVLMWRTNPKMRELSGPAWLGGFVESGAVCVVSLVVFVVYSRRDGRVYGSLQNLCEFCKTLAFLIKAINADQF
jgi:hypothetical protein